MGKILKRDSPNILEEYGALASLNRREVCEALSSIYGPLGNSMKLSVGVQKFIITSKIKVFRPFLDPEPAGEVVMEPQKLHKNVILF